MKDKSLRKLKRAIKWDAYTLKENRDGPDIYYDLIIHELDFKESLSILNRLKSEFSLRFYIEYGVY